MTPLHWATEKGHVGIIDLLVRHGADLNCDDKVGNSGELVGNRGNRVSTEVIWETWTFRPVSAVTGG